MASCPPAKRSRTAAAGNISNSRPSVLRDPRTILTWNADGLAARCGNDGDVAQFQALLRATGRPDVICIQEARLKCRSADRRDEPLRSEMDVMRPFFGVTDGEGYLPIFSLADKRNAGTLTLVRRDLVGGPGAKSTVVENSAFSVAGALDLMLRAYSLEDDEELKGLVQQCGSGGGGGGGGGGSCNEPPKKKQQQQTSLMAFMKAKPRPSSSTVGSKSIGRHHEEGRIQFIRFASLDVLQTYVPNNGKTPESFARRRAFDQDMQSLVTTRLAILRKAGDADRPIIWAGDLNVARTHLDGTHHTTTSKGGYGSAEVREYWTDPSKCPDCKRQDDPGDVGIPGFTPNERRRFEEILRRGGLVDVWRHLHPHGVTDENVPHLGSGRGGTAEKNPWDRAEYTWRGSVARNAARGRYQGKGQRIDYFLLSERAMGRVESCDILGYGEYREGYFCGSDHCPTLLVMKEEEKGDADGKAEQKKMPSKANFVDLTSVSSRGT